MTFEEKINRLDDILDKLSGEVSLQDGLKLFEEGANISKECFQELETVKGKVSVIKKDMENFTIENFDWG